MHNALINIPLWCHMVNSTMDQVLLDYAYIKMKDPSDDTLRNEIMMNLAKSIDDNVVEVEDLYAQ